jgi:hypothetical protein
MNDQFRSESALTYRNHLINMLGRQCPNVTSGAELIAQALRTRNPEFEAALGWRTEPPFPGAGEVPQEMPNGRFRMICASRLYLNDVEAGVIFTTFYSGKSFAVYVSPPGNHIPPEYTAFRNWPAPAR